MGLLNRPQEDLGYFFGELPVVSAHVGEAFAKLLACAHGAKHRFEEVLMKDHFLLDILHWVPSEKLIVGDHCAHEFDDVSKLGVSVGSSEVGSCFTRSTKRALLAQDEIAGLLDILGLEEEFQADTGSLSRRVEGLLLGLHLSLVSGQRVDIGDVSKRECVEQVVELVEPLPVLGHPGVEELNCAGDESGGEGLVALHGHALAVVAKDLVVLCLVQVVLLLHLQRDEHVFEEGGGVASAQGIGAVQQEGKEVLKAVSL